MDGGDLDVFFIKKEDLERERERERESEREGGEREIERCIHLFSYDVVGRARGLWADREKRKHPTTAKTTPLIALILSSSSFSIEGSSYTRASADEMDSMLIVFLPLSAQHTHTKAELLSMDGCNEPQSARESYTDIRRTREIKSRIYR